MANRSSNRCPTHPGAFLREIVIPALKMPKVQIAESIGISRQTLFDLTSERQAVTPQLAVRLGVVFGNTPEVWLSMQAAYDLWHARRNVDVSNLRSLS